MNSSKALRNTIQLTSLRKINSSVPVGRKFSTDCYRLSGQYSKIAGVTAGAGIVSFIIYGLTSDFKAYCYSKKKVSQNIKSARLLGIQFNILQHTRIQLCILIEYLII